MQTASTAMSPPTELLPDVLPTDRLTATGRPLPVLRSSLRLIPNLRNAASIVSAYLQSFGVVTAAAVIQRPLVTIAAFVLMGRGFVLLGTLAHESVHRLIFRNRRWNDWAGRWLLGYPSFFPTDLYRRDHIAHHRDELGPEEPDANVYRGFPITLASFRRKLMRDLFFVSGWRYVKALARTVDRPRAKAELFRLMAVQTGLFAVFTAVGRAELYVLLWLAPWMTVWRVLTRLRMVAEHGGMTRSDDRRLTTHHVRQTYAARFWIVPYNLGWHLAHHVDMAIPFRNLPKLHAELVASGWVTPDLEYPTYLALWRRLASGREERAE
jgi:fatty acid desaturase